MRLEEWPEEPPRHPQKGRQLRLRLPVAAAGVGRTPGMLEWPEGHQGAFVDGSHPSKGRVDERP